MATDDCLVPDFVWTLSRIEQLGWYNNQVLDHAALRTANAILKPIVTPPIARPLMFVIGPSGVGKSTLLLKTVERVLRDSADAMATDLSYIPVAGIEAHAPHNGNYDWRDHAQRSCMSLQEIAMDKKVFPKSSSARTTTTQWMTVFETALKYRRPQFFYIDEAQHLLKMAKGRRVVDQTDFLKSLIAETHVPLLLVGTYDLLQLVDLSEQLGRRSRQCHFPRYDVGDKDQRREFRTFIGSMRAHLPFRNPPDLDPHWQHIYQQTLGCCGVLHDWMVDACKLAFMENAEFAFEHLERTQRGWKTVEKALRKIHEGEKAMKEQEDSRGNVIRLLKMRPAKASGKNTEPAPETSSASEASTKTPNAQSASKRKKSGKRPGRNPTRDRVAPVPHAKAEPASAGNP